MYSASYHSRAPAQPHNSQPAHHHHMYQTHQPSQQDSRTSTTLSSLCSNSQQQQQHQQQHQHQYPPSKQQHQQHQQHQHQQQASNTISRRPQHTQYPLQRAAGQAFSVPRTVSTPSWMSGTHSAAYPASSNISPPTSATAPLRRRRRAHRCSPTGTRAWLATRSSPWPRPSRPPTRTTRCRTRRTIGMRRVLRCQLCRRQALFRIPSRSMQQPHRRRCTMAWEAQSTFTRTALRPLQPMAPGSAMQSYHPAMVSVSPGGVVYQGSCRHSIHREDWCTVHRVRRCHWRRARRTMPTRPRLGRIRAMCRIWHRRAHTTRASMR